VGFEHAISLDAGARLGRMEALILCGAVTVLMGCLIAIGATSKGARRQSGFRYRVCGQAALLLVIAVAGGFAYRIDRVALVLGLVGVCLLQVGMARAALRRTFAVLLAPA
jgi:hypothetical protein